MLGNCSIGISLPLFALVIVGTTVGEVDVAVRFVPLFEQAIATSKGITATVMQT
jgi:hypothetical protein